MKEQLKEVGLTENEATIYLALIEHGAINAGKITEKSGIHRRSVYDALDRLIEKGLVGYITSNNINLYKATDPKHLLEIVKKKEESIQEIIPNLERIYNSKKEEKETLFFKGKNGVREIFQDQISVGKEVLILGGSKNAKEILKYYLPHHENDRIRKKINVRILFGERSPQDKKIPLSKVKYLPNDYVGPTATNIYGDTVAMIIWTENPYAILIRDKDVADSYRKQFEYIWNSIE